MNKLNEISNKRTLGIHHITAIVGNPQENIDFYAGVLGLRMIKQTVNFDDPGTYHLYFSDGISKPGTVITFFPWNDASKGVIGGGQVGVTTYAIPKGAMTFWEERLKKFEIDFQKTSRFGEEYIQFKDFHGLNLELVERDRGEINTWKVSDITPEVAIKGFGGAILYSTQSDKTAEVLENVMGLEFIGSEGDYRRYQSTADLGNVVDLKTTSLEIGKMGVGTVHHIAWRAIDDVDHIEWQTHARKHGYGVTEVADRNYFKAIYFREHCKILFEIATDGPGFARDEPIETMGQKLMLPPQYENLRNQLGEILIPIEVKELGKL